MSTPEEKVECAICGTAENLIYHHDSYEPEVIRVLCRSCHAKLHHRNPHLPKRPKGFQSTYALLSIIKPAYLSVKKLTKSRLFRTRGKLEAKDGKRRSLQDVINELIDYFEEMTNV